MTLIPQQLVETLYNERSKEGESEMNDGSRKPRDYFFIDYDDDQNNGDDTYNVLFGLRENIPDADYIASFLEEHDANEYCDWKNGTLDSLEDGFSDDYYDEDDEYDTREELEDAWLDNEPNYNR